MSEPVGVGFRKKITLFGENFYLTLTEGDGEYVVDCTVPYENRPERKAEREIIETICHEITVGLNELKEKGEKDNVLSRKAHSV